MFGSQVAHVITAWLSLFIRVAELVTEHTVTTSEGVEDLSVKAGPTVALSEEEVTQGERKL